MRPVEAVSTSQKVAKAAEATVKATKNLSQSVQILDLELHSFCIFCKQKLLRIFSFEFTHHSVFLTKLSVNQLIFPTNLTAENSIFEFQFSHHFVESWFHSFFAHFFRSFFARFQFSNHLHWKFIFPAFFSNLLNWKFVFRILFPTKDSVFK